MLDTLQGIGSAIMTPLYLVTSAILSGWHWLFTRVGMPTGSGWTWALSIIGLTVAIRALLIPLFVKQIKASRNMQVLQPKVKELQKKYGHDRERLAQETMALYKDAGTNPFSSCMPLLLQAPIFLALFRLLDNAANGVAKGVLSDTQARSIQDAELLGAKIADRFWGAESLSVQILTITLVILMTITTFTTQRQLMRKNMPESALTGPYAQQQKLLLYVLPVVFAVGGIAFPVGVLLYWTTSNLWTMGQQFYVIRRNPAPGTPAFKAKQQRDERKGKPVTDDPLAAAPSDPPPAPKPRQQPKKQSRSQRKAPAAAKSRPTPAEPSLDIVSRVDRGEADTALTQTAREIAQRRDFKNAGAVIGWQGEYGVEICANAEDRALAVLDLFKGKLVERGVSRKALVAGAPQTSGSLVKVPASLKHGISQEEAKRVGKLIRDEGPDGVRVQVRGDALRVSAKQHDDLQAVVALVEGAHLDFPIQFVNNR